MPRIGSGEAREMTGGDWQQVRATVRDRLAKRGWEFVGRTRRSVALVTKGTRFAKREK
jgi:hypothetical protein